jgi:hypothetical protein
LTNWIAATSCSYNPRQLRHEGERNRSFVLGRSARDSYGIIGRSHANRTAKSHVTAPAPWGLASFFEEGFSCIGIEREAEYVTLASQHLSGYGFEARLISSDDRPAEVTEIA